MKQKGLIYTVIPLIGTILCLWYIKEATCDIVYSDYIRIVNKYLPDVWKAENFFRPDVLTRIPVYYLVRAFNVRFFNYSTTFEMGLGVLGLGLSALVLSWYCAEKKVGIIWYAFFMFLLFGLDKWEMLINGTGWAHFLAFACFYYHYLVFDRVLYGREKRFDRILLLVMPPVITLAIAGPYCAVYSVVMVLSYGFAWIKGQGERKQTLLDRRFCLLGIITVVIPLLLYMWSDSYAIEDHDGAVKIGLWAMLGQNPMFFPRFLLKSLASMVVGGETLTQWMENGILTDGSVYLMGVFLAGAYLLSFFFQIRDKLYEETLLPLMLLFAGMGNHGIILISRYIFAREDYGMSSRYALQYQAGVLGIVLTFALIEKKIRGKKKAANEAAGRLASRPLESRLSESRKEIYSVIAERILMLAVCLVLFIGHGYTDYIEIRKAPYREAYGEHIAEVALQYEITDDDTLRETFDYREGRKESAADVRRALGILKEHGWNVFGR